MAHTFQNLGFETAGPYAGGAQGWRISQAATLRKLASYDEPAAFGDAVEGFGENWLSNEDFFSEFLGLLQDLFPALFNDPGNPDSFEPFEKEWSLNQFFAFDFSDIGAEFALYDSGTPEPVEDYEEEWLSNEAFVTAFVGIGTDLTAAVYDSGSPEAVEDFEEEWANDFPVGHNPIIPTFQGEMLIVASGPTIDNQTAADFAALGFSDSEPLIVIRGSASNGGSKTIAGGGVAASILTVGSAADETTPVTAYVTGGDWLTADFGAEEEKFDSGWTETLDGF